MVAHPILINRPLVETDKGVRLCRPQERCAKYCDSARHNASMSRLDPRLLLQGYAAGIFPMADSRDAAELFWVEPRNRAIIPLDRVPSVALAAPDAPLGPLRRHPRPRFRRRHRRLRRSRGNLDQRRDRARHARPPRHRPRPFDRGLAADGADWSAAFTGCRLGRAFFGESMFSRATDASKVALAWLVARLKVGGFTLLDCQFMTDHLASLGAVNVTARPIMSRCCRRRSAAARLAAARRRTSPVRRSGDRRRRGVRRPISWRSTGCSSDRRGRAPAARRICHRAALGPDVVDRMLDHVERRRFLVQPAREDPLPAAVGALRRRAGRRRRSAPRSPTARSFRRRAGGRSASLTRTDWPGCSVTSRTIPLRLLSSRAPRPARPSA